MNRFLPGRAQFLFFGPFFHQALLTFLLGHSGGFPFPVFFIEGILGRARGLTGIAVIHQDAFTGFISVYKAL